MGERGTVLFLKNLTVELTEFLVNLNDTDNYWVSLSFYPNIDGYKNCEGIKMSISTPIVVNIDSSPLLLTKFIMNRLNLMIDFYYLDDSIINSEDSVIIVKFCEIEF